MKRLLILFAALALLTASCASALADSVIVSGMNPKTQNHQVEVDKVSFGPALWYSEWQNAYPDTKMNTEKAVPYRSTNAVLKALAGKSIKQDVLLLDAITIDWNEVKASGGLANLSDDPVLAAWVAQMHPVFAEAARQDGALYGLPCGVTFGNFLSVNAEAWALAGYQESDRPTSFTSLISFLEGWAARCQSAPMERICVYDGFDQLAETSYTVWLTELLIEQYADQCLAQGVPASFDRPEIVGLLERISALGRELYQHDNPAASEYRLIQDFSDVSTLPCIIPGRLTDEDPFLIPARVDFLCVPQSSRHPDAARNFLRLYMGLIHDHTYDDYSATTVWDCDAMLANALLFANAAGDIPAYDYGSVERVRQQIASQEAIAADPGASEQARARAQSNLERYERNHWLERTLKAEYQLTAAELVAYQSLAGNLRAVSGYNSVVSSRQTRTLIRQFAAGSLSAQEFVQRLDRIPQ